MTKTLVVVESPAKAKTIEKYLGPDFTVRASFGHVRDLPKSQLAIDVEHDFAMTYEVPDEKAKHVAELRRVRKAVDEGRLQVVGAYYELSTGRVHFSEPIINAVKHP